MRDQGNDAIAFYPAADLPAFDAGRIRALLERELALPSRLGHLLLLLNSLGCAVALASLWVTEPALPPRTHGAFALLLAVLLSWASYSGWVLRTRRILYGRQRVIAARLAVAFTACFVLGSAVVGGLTGRIDAALAAMALGCSLLVVAVVLLRRAHQHREALLLLRATLERELAAS